MTIRAALRRQGDTCTQMGSAFTGRLLHLLAERMQPGSRLAAPLLGPELGQGACHLIFHTVAWQYFPPPTRHKATAAIEAAGARATAEAPLAWFGMEADDRDKRGAALRLRLWTGERAAGQSFDMGRADFHGRWVDWWAN